MVFDLVRYLAEHGVQRFELQRMLRQAPRFIDAADELVAFFGRQYTQRKCLLDIAVGSIRLLLKNGPA